MINIIALIAKFGQIIKIDTVNVSAYVNEDKSTKYKNSKIYSSFNTKVIFTEKQIGLDAKIELNAKNFLVLEVLDIAYNAGNIIYCETAIYEDDFIHDLKFYKQSLSMAGCNLPSVVALPYIEVKARLQTVKPSSYLNLSLQGAKVPTHKITINYQAGISASDLIHFGTRRFEILAIENIDERNIFLEIDCIEVLNA